MKLSDLKTGERGVIVKVMGHGGFRKRIVEMGFIKGKIVDVLQNAPLHDPVKYKLMGYEVSLRHSEADMIEVISVEEAERIEKQNKLDQAQRAAARKQIQDPRAMQLQSQNIEQRFLDPIGRRPNGFARKLGKHSASVFSTDNAHLSRSPSYLRLRGFVPGKPP